MWKIYYTSKTFKQSLLTNFGLPDQATGSLSIWFEENVAVTRTFGWNSKRGRSIGFMQCGDFGLCIKKYGTGASVPSLRWVRSYLRCQEAKRIYRRHKKIFERGISVPEPYACLYEYDSNLQQSAVYLISQKLEGADTFSKYWEKHLAQAEILLLFDTLGHVIANLHRCGYTHGDLIGNNIMVNDNKVFLIDLDDSRHLFYPFAIGKIAMDLTRFIRRVPPYKDNQPNTEYTNVALSLFLQRYFEVSGIDRSQLLIAMRKFLDKRKKRYLRKHLEEKVLQVQRAYDILHQLKT